MSRRASIWLSVAALLVSFAGLGVSMSGYTIPEVGIPLAVVSLVGVAVSLLFFFSSLRERPPLPEPLVTWRPLPQGEDFLVQVQNGGGRGSFSASAKILGVRGGFPHEVEGKRGAMVNLPWEGSEDLTTEIAAGGFRQLRIAAMKPIMETIPLGSPLHPGEPRHDTERENSITKRVFLGIEGAHENFYVYRPTEEGEELEEWEDPEPLEILLRLTVLTDPSLARPHQTTLRLRPSWDSIRAI